MQRKKFFSILIALVFLGVFIFFNEFLGIKSFVFRLMKPFLETVRWVNEFGGPSQEEFKTLARNQQQKALIFELEQLKLENAVLKKALFFKEENKLSLKGARVIFYSQELGKEFLLVDQGKEAGVKVGDLVVDAEQVFAGVIKETSDDFAKVGVASNPGETFEVEITSLRVKAVAKGLGARAFTIDLLPLDTPLHKGDFVGLLNKGKFLLLAEITGEKGVSGSAFKEAQAVYLARPELAREVFILSSGQQ